MTGNSWTEMFEPRGPRSVPGVPPVPAQTLSEDPEGPELDPVTYRPWIVQRGRSRAALLLHLRRYEERSGLWSGWALSYPHLVAVEYTGDQMLSLDFGTRQFMIQGTGLDELVRHLQAGSVLAIQEYSAKAWPTRDGPGLVRSIVRVGA